MFKNRHYMAWHLRNDHGMKYKEIGELISVSPQKARRIVLKYQHKIEAEVLRSVSPTVRRLRRLRNPRRRYLLSRQKKEGKNG